MGTPPKPSDSGFGGERRSNGMNENSRLRGGERYEVCDDEYGGIEHCEYARW